MKPNAKVVKHKTPSLAKEMKTVKSLAVKSKRMAKEIKGTKMMKVIHSAAKKNVTA